MRASTLFKLGFGALAAGSAAIQGANALIRRREDLDPDAISRPGGMFYLRGVGVHFIDRGEGLPLVLLHGFGGSTYSFRHQLGPLAERFRVFALDLPGFGLSDRPSEADLSLTAQAARVRELLDRLDIARATILGHSMGGTIAMRLAATHPERVERLILAGSPAPDQLPRIRLPWLLRACLPLPYALWWTRPDSLRRALRRIVYDASSITDEIVTAYTYPVRLRGTAASLFKMAADIQRDTPIDPSGIAIRSLLLWGEADTAVPLATAHRLHATMPDARLEVIPRAGHLVLEEQPELCNERIMRFLNETPRPRMVTAR